jgi:hypothetical protein
MRIALFTETFLPKVDGIVTRLRHTVEHLERNGDRVLVFVPKVDSRNTRAQKFSVFLVSPPSLSRTENRRPSSRHPQAVRKV